MVRNKRFKTSLLESDHILAKEFDAERNCITADKVSCSESIIKRWWVCSVCKHKWEATVNFRHNKNTRGGCPVCKNRLLIPDVNSLEALRPDLASEWHPVNNGKLKPSMVLPGVDTVVWWKCKECNHEWENSIGKRVRGQGCKRCKTGYTSFPEKAVFYYLSKVFPSTKNRMKLVGNLEADVFVPEHNIVIEYDGEYWHKDRYVQDCSKVAQFSKFNMIRIREGDLESIPNCINFHIRRGNTCDLEYSIHQIFLTIMGLGVYIKVPSISISRDRLDILSVSKQIDLKHSLFSKYPEIASEWDYALNGSVTPQNVAYASNNVYWWKCVRGHSYPMEVSKRTYNGSNCSICSNRRLVRGINDLTTCSPLISSEFNSSDEVLSPSDLINGSHKIVNWNCSRCNSIFTCSVSDRVSEKSRDCPTCKRDFAILGRLTFNGELVGLRFLYGCRFVDVESDLIKKRGICLDVVNVSIVELKEVGNLVISDIEYTKNLHIRSIGDNDRYFFKRLSNFLKRSNNYIPVSTLENYLTDLS